MENRKETIVRILNALNNEDDYGGIWLPAIQRPFVWKKEQIELLFDSIMREYPIGTLLVWKTKEPLRLRRFVGAFRSGMDPAQFSVPPQGRRKSILLDGQQRVQGLFIALRGSYDGDDLYFNVLSGKGDDDGRRYVFRFLPAEEARASEGWVGVKDLLSDSKGFYRKSDEIISGLGPENPPESVRDLVRSNIDRLLRQLRDRDTIIFQQLDSVYQPDSYSLDDIVEIFIRANAGGTMLGKSDLLFAILRGNWDSLDEDLAGVVGQLSDGGFTFSADFIIKTGLVLTGRGAEISVDAMRDTAALRAVQDGLGDMTAALRDVTHMIRESTFIKSAVALADTSALIPLVCFRRHFPEAWNNTDKGYLCRWLLLVLVSGVFTGNSDSLINALVDDIKRSGRFDVPALTAIIRRRAKRTDPSPREILRLAMGQKQLYPLFNLLYDGDARERAFIEDLPEIVHIFPPAMLRSIKSVNRQSGRKTLKYRRFDRDQLANLILCEREDAAKGKLDEPAEKRLKGKSAAYLKRHMIPADQSLWKGENYDAFIAERKKLILRRLKEVIVRGF